MGLRVWNGRICVHGIWSICQKFEEIVREGKQGITTPFEVIASGMQRARSMKEDKTHSYMPEEIYPT
jgi:hypothetical protein